MHFYLEGFTSQVDHATPLSGDYYLEWMLNGVWHPKQLWFSAGGESTTPQLSGSPTGSRKLLSSTSPSLPSAEQVFSLVGYTSFADHAGVWEGNTFYVEWFIDGAWTPREVWFTTEDKLEQGAEIGRSTLFSATNLPELVRISIDDADTDDWGYWKLGFVTECGEKAILEEPAASDGPPPTFGSMGVANWAITDSDDREELSRNLPDDPFLDWRNWWLGEDAGLSNTYNIGEWSLLLCTS